MLTMKDVKRLMEAMDDGCYRQSIETFMQDNPDEGAPARDWFNQLEADMIIKLARTLFGHQNGIVERIMEAAGEHYANCPDCHQVFRTRSTEAARNAFPWDLAEAVATEMLKGIPATPEIGDPHSVHVKAQSVEMSMFFAHTKEEVRRSTNPAVKALSTLTDDPSLGGTELDTALAEVIIMAQKLYAAK